MKVIIMMNEDLKMSLGKRCSQIAHGVDSLLRNVSFSKLQEWRSEGAKIVCLKAREKQLRSSLVNAPVQGYPIFDAGRTEVPPGSMTLIIFEPIFDSETFFNSFSLL